MTWTYYLSGLAITLNELPHNHNARGTQSIWKSFGCAIFRTERDTMFGVEVCELGDKLMLKNI